MLVAIGVGRRMGPLVFVRLVDDPRRPAFMLGPFLLRAAVDLVLGYRQRVRGGSGGTGGLWGRYIEPFTCDALLPSYAPDQQRGRVFAGVDLIWQFGRRVSLLVGGVLADLARIRAVYYVGAALLVLAARIRWHGLRRPLPGPGASAAH
jgi:predicted MFS family arabinose efflux permease